MAPDARFGVAALGGSRASYLPATLVTGFPPMAVPGIDLSGAPGLAAALDRATLLNGVVATPIASPTTGTRGLFLVAPAPNQSYYEAPKEHAAKVSRIRPSTWWTWGPGSSRGSSTAST